MFGAFGKSRRSRLFLGSRFVSFSHRHGKRQGCNDREVLKFISCIGVLSSVALCVYNQESESWKYDALKGWNQSALGHPMMMATSSTDPNSAPLQHTFKLDDSVEPSEEADFIIIGYGNAGKAAAKSLEEKCPRARIMIVDPHSIPSRVLPDSQDHFGRKNVERSHVIGSVVAFDHSKQTIDVFTTHASSMKRLRYKHSIVIASGVRGAPPPESLIDERVTERILELRSTQIPALNQYILNQSLTDKKAELPTRQMFPILPVQSVRQITLMAASQGAKICILGSDLEAVELAIGAAAYQKEKRSMNKVCLLFGGSAPLNGMLPKYLSSAVSKRLRAHGIYVAERSLVRYISSIEDGNRKGDGKVEIHMVKSFDTMETKRYQCDFVIGEFT